MDDMFRALIVEDNRIFRQSLKEILHTRFPSIEIIEAEEGREAFEKIATVPPDLIFMDIKLPGDSGIVLTRKIKTSYSVMTIVILTDYDLKEYREAAFQAGADYFFTKSTSPEVIFRLVESIVSKQAAKQ
jgi:DNA-binding NarL/FixJ family response regulator